MVFCLGASLFLERVGEGVADAAVVVLVLVVVVVVVVVEEEADGVVGRGMRAELKGK